MAPALLISVDGRQLGGEPRQQAPQCGTIGKIRAVGKEPPSERAHPLPDGAAVVFERAADARNVGACLRQRAGDGETDAPPAARNQSKFSIQREKIQN